MITTQENLLSPFSLLTGISTERKKAAFSSGIVVLINILYPISNLAARAILGTIAKYQ